MATKRSIEWTLMARSDFKEILAYYKKRSPQGYLLVKKAVLNTLDLASKSSTAFITDPLKQPKDESVRTFTVYHTRVTYLTSKTRIIVLRLRHTSREPLEF